jgi:hypothetical protein
LLSLFFIFLSSNLGGLGSLAIEFLSDHSLPLGLGFKSALSFGLDLKITLTSCLFSILLTLKLLCLSALHLFLLLFLFFLKFLSFLGFFSCSQFSFDSKLLSSFLQSSLVLLLTLKLLNLDPQLRLLLMTYLNFLKFLDRMLEFTVLQVRLSIIDKSELFFRILGNILSLDKLLGNLIDELGFVFLNFLQTSFKVA